MTPAQKLAADRRAQMMMTRRERGDDGGLLGAIAGMAASSALGDVGPTSVPLDAEQGPAMGGGLLHKGPAASAPAGRGITAPGKTHFFIKGRGPTIDFGPIFKPKSTGADPMQADPFQETKGVGGFFRRLLGDNSDELNSQWQQARIERRAAGEDRDAAFLNRMEEKGADQEFTQGENKSNRDANSTESAADRKLRRDMQEQGYFDQVSLNKMAQDAAAMRDVFGAEVGYDMQDRRIQGEKDVAGIRLLGTGGGGTPRPQVEEAGKIYYGKDGRAYEWVNDLKTGRTQKVYVDGGATGEAGGYTPDQANKVREAMRLRKAAETPMTRFGGGGVVTQPQAAFQSATSARPERAPAIDPSMFTAPPATGGTLQDLLNQSKRKNPLLQALGL